MSTEQDAAAWRESRREVTAAHSAAVERRRAAESGRARALLAEFVAEAATRGPAPVPLRVQSYDGRHHYRTRLTGWYLKNNESLAVDTDGAFYVLSVPASLTAALRGAEVAPSDPPLVLGAGGRDGESIDLVDALARLRARRPAPGQPA